MYESVFGYEHRILDDIFVKSNGSLEEMLRVLFETIPFALAHLNESEPRLPHMFLSLAVFHIITP